jgi:hypothetical protein
MDGSALDGTALWDAPRDDENDDEDEDEVSRHVSGWIIPNPFVAGPATASGHKVLPRPRCKTFSYFKDKHLDCIECSHSQAVQGHEGKETVTV